ncbi:hypothetical protein AN958_12221 [Leucoagaricus sp. SymC.cos]|nr:hypothetical protein AN958_12221 [Leucoagaricus sp. SymC.cos]
MLVSVPTIHTKNENGIKFSIENIQSQLDLKTVKLIGHIWVHDVSLSYLVDKGGTPWLWRRLKKILERTVKMDQVSLLLTGWEKVSLEEGVEQELGIRRALTEDVKNGLLFERLPLRDQALVWSVLDEVIGLSCVGLGDKRGIKGKRNGISGEEIMAEVLQKNAGALQKEIDEICLKLNNLAHGKKLCEEIRKYFADRKARMESLLFQMDDNHEIPRKKKEAEATLEHEYLIFRKTMWAFFEEIEKLDIEIEPKLKNFYGFKCGLNEVR